MGQSTDTSLECRVQTSGGKPRHSVVVPLTMGKVLSKEAVFIQEMKDSLKERGIRVFLKKGEFNNIFLFCGQEMSMAGIKWF